MGKVYLKLGNYYQPARLAAKRKQIIRFIKPYFDHSPLMSGRRMIIALFDQSWQMTVLFIDDDPEDIQLFCEILQEILPEVTCNSITRCTDLEADLAAFETPDVILLDAHMTPITSQECLQQLKALVNLNKTKIIIHTGSISEVESVDFLENGATAIVYKAADFATIKSNLTKVIMS